MKNKGFSFVELLVAVAILGIISLPIVSSFVLAARIDAKATAVSSAGNAADDVLLMVTEIDQMPTYGESVNGISYDAKYYLSYYASKGYFTLPFGEASLTAEAEEKQPITLTLRYNDYPVELTLTNCDTFYRVDITLSCNVNGETIQITRKGVLSL